MVRIKNKSGMFFLLALLLQASCVTPDTDHFQTRAVPKIDLAIYQAPDDPLHSAIVCKSSVFQNPNSAWSFPVENLAKKDCRRVICQLSSADDLFPTCSGHRNSDREFDLRFSWWLNEFEQIAWKQTKNNSWSYDNNSKLQEREAELLASACKRGSALHCIAGLITTDNASHLGSDSSVKTETNPRCELKKVLCSQKSVLCKLSFGNVESTLEVALANAKKGYKTLRSFKDPCIESGEFSIAFKPEAIIGVIPGLDATGMLLRQKSKSEERLAFRAKCVEKDLAACAQWLVEIRDYGKIGQRSIISSHETQALEVELKAWARKICKLPTARCDWEGPFSALGTDPEAGVLYRDYHAICGSTAMSCLGNSCKGTDLLASMFPQKMEPADTTRCQYRSPIIRAQR